MQANQLEALISNYAPEESAVAVITGRERRHSISAKNRRLTWYDNVAGVDDLEGLARCTLAIVFGLPAGTGKKQVTHLLASLRDRYATRIVVEDTGSLFSLGDLLALGFEKLPQHGPYAAYLYDPDSPSRRREWNSPRHWANPENFDKYRW